MPKNELPAGLRPAEVARVVKAAQKQKRKLPAAELHPQASG
jgi:hypothetical protein